MIKNHLICQKIKNYLYHLPSAFLASLYYQFPAKKLKVIGVTGTDGKTTTSTLIYEILKKSGKEVALISTVSAKIKDEEIDTGFHVTSPDPWLLQKLMKKIKSSGIEYVVLEATSHGLDQFRFLGVNFLVGVITNVTHEHLDYHQNIINYLKAKATLFNKVKYAILNKDDFSFDYLFKKLKNKKGVKIITYGLNNKADFTPKNFHFSTSLPGEYNLYNCLAAIAVTSALGIKEDIIREAVKNFPGVKGRMEKIDEGQNFTVFVDFAHTPNALEKVLKTLKEQKKQGKLIAVFGAAGLRDKSKRPIMGEVAGKLADFVVITAEDPRTEKVEDICQQIAEGCQKVKAKFKIIPDRQKAIDFAICELAKEGDIIVICGKGHEQSMCYGNKEFPWSDQEAVKKSLKKKQNRI